MTETTETVTTRFFVPTKPYSLTDCINRISAATGSMQYAAAATAADYNGHYNTLSWNNYRGYYVGEYFWGGRHVFIRSRDFAVALAAALKEFDRQDRGASLHISVRPEDTSLAASHPRLSPHTPEAEREVDTSWRTWKHDEAGTALRMERQFGVPHIHHLIEATDRDDYQRRVDAEFASRRRPH